MLLATGGCLSIRSKGSCVMSTTVTLEEAQARLPQLVAGLAGGDEVIITQDQQPVAKLVGHNQPGRKRRKAGSAKGKLVIVREDEEHLKDFEGYMR
jgi:antitoxin (DNA-binding transcriptional repressor) of toxin-antitoxin stability system